MFIEGPVQVIQQGQYRSGFREGERYTRISIADGVSRVQVDLEGWHTFERWDTIHAVITINQSGSRTYVNCDEWHKIQPDYAELREQLDLAEQMGRSDFSER